MNCNHSITEEDVRNYILDRTLEDNELEIDLCFSQGEIADAMRRSARDYNSIHPRVAEVDADRLPAYTNMFLDAIAAQLYMSRMAKLMRNDMDYTAGDVTTNIVQKQIAHLKELIVSHKKLFMDAAQAEKAAINWGNCWGQLG